MPPTKKAKKQKSKKANIYINIPPTKKAKKAKKQGYTLIYATHQKSKKAKKQKSKDIYF